MSHRTAPVVFAIDEHPLGQVTLPSGRDIGAKVSALAGYRNSVLASMAITQLTRSSDPDMP
jgi:hypothetical protein